MRKLVPCALLFCLTPLGAFGQTSAGPSQAIDEVRKGYPIHVGGLYVSPSVLLKELGVDTNVFNQAGEQKADFTFTVTPKVNVAVPIAHRALVKGTAAADAIYYKRFATERSVNPQLTLRGEVYANRLTLFAEEAYLNTHQRANEELDLRVRRLLNDVGAGAAVRLTHKFSLAGAVHARATRLDGNAVFRGQRLQDTLNDNAWAYSLTASQQLTPLTNVSLLYEAQQDRFAHDPVRDTDSFRLMPGVDFKPRALISGSARVGYRSFRPKSGLLPSASGLVSQLGLSYTLRGSTMLAVTYDRDFLFSYEVSSPYFLADSAGISVRRAVGGHFDVIANATRHRYDYRHLLTPISVASPVTRVETTDIYGLNLGYRLKRETRVGFGMQRAKRQSTTDSTRAYSGLRFVTTISSGITR
jgi:hypothetical protein